jgi:hypothetical protein
LLLSVLLPIVYILPSGFIFAMTGQGVRYPPHLFSLHVQPYLIMPADKHQRHCANHTRNTSSWQTFCQHDIQSLFGADVSGWYIVYARSQVGTLCESSTTRNVSRYVKKNAFAPLITMDTDVMVYSAIDIHYPSGVYPSWG